MYIRRYSCQILMKLQVSRETSEKKNQISNFTKIRPVAAELLRADGRADRHDEANSRFSRFCERA
jgi:hypothetical protein